MQHKKPAKTETIRVRVPAEVKAWYRRSAAKSYVDISDLIRPLIMRAFETRHE